MNWIARLLRKPIDMRKPIVNLDHEFGEASTYFRADVIGMDGRRRAALFTADQLQKAVDRALRNPEDVVW